MPKFRYTGTAQSGGSHETGGIPVVWDTEKLNVDAVINEGVFLCMRPGIYYFTAALCAQTPNNNPTQGRNSVGVYITHNSKDEVYAR